MKRIVLFFILLILMPISGYSMSRYEINADSNLVVLAHKIVKNQVGTIEKTNRNDGDVLRYLKPLGLPAGSPYCAAGIYWAYLTAADSLSMHHSIIPIPKTGLANAIYNYAKQQGRKIDYYASTYDLLVWNKANTPFGHIEVIDSVGKAGNVITIGFNSSKIINGKRLEGVFYQKRNIYHPLSRMKVRGIVSFNFAN